jgi:two-component system sensor histidine kinase SenX3
VKKLWPTLLGLSFGALVLWIFFAWLFTLFRTERDDGAREAAAHRTALEAYAQAEVSAALRSQLLVGSEQLELARRDPLIDDSALFLVAGDVQVVPPLPSPEEQPASSPSADSPQLRRRELVEQISDAIDRNDRPAIEQGTRALLAERARYVIPIVDDVPIVLEVVRVLQRAGPSPELMRMLLRDGVSVDGKSVPLGLEGLQRAVLRRKSRLSATRFEALCEQVAKASRELRVPAADFQARCSSVGSTRPPVWQLLEGESLWRKDLSTPTAWFVRAVDLDALILELTGRLRARRLLASLDTLVLEVPAGSTALEAVSVSLKAPEWIASARKREERFVLKSLLLGVSAALTLAIAALAVLAQRRKLRFVELKSDFVATVSHELRTPLASMRVMAETLERRLDGHPGAKDYPARIVREVDGLSLLVENILSFNRLDKGRWQRRDGEVPLASLEPMLREEAERYPAAKVELTFTGFEDVVLRADRELVQLLFLNLLRNACKYNANDPVRVAFACDGTTVRVTDNGVGIPPAELSNVFVEFNRLPGQRGRGGAGSGLGLALARRIMTLHHGSIDVERSTAEGTTFVLKFPAS